MLIITYNEWRNRLHNDRVFGYVTVDPHSMNTSQNIMFSSLSLSLFPHAQAIVFAYRRSTYSGFSYVLMYMGQAVLWVMI